jgi:hypothetical protein
VAGPLPVVSGDSSGASGDAMSSVSFFANNAQGAPTATLLAELAALAREGKIVALTCFKQLFTIKQAVWFACGKSDRVAAVTVLVSLLDTLGHTPMLAYVAARGLYLESQFSSLKLSNPLLMRQVLRAVKDDIDRVCEERLSLAELESRAFPIWNNWQSVLRATWAVFVSAPPGANVALECIRVTRLLLVDLNNYRALSPPIESVDQIRHFLTSLAKQLHSNSVSEVIYQRASWKLLHGVLLGQSAKFLDLTETICVSFLSPLQIERSSVARFVGAALDHPQIRASEMAARIVTPERLEALLNVMCLKFLVIEDVIEAGSDWITTLGSDLLEEDCFYLLVLSIGRCAIPSVKVSLQLQLSKLIDNCATLSPQRRAAVYTCLECCAEKPFALVENILSRELNAFQTQTSAASWPVFRACAKLVESVSFSVISPHQFDACLFFLLFILSPEKNMNIVARIHACVALRALVDWQRVTPSSHVAQRLAKCSLRISVAVSDLFRSCYSDPDDPFEDDLGNYFLLLLFLKPYFIKRSRCCCSCCRCRQRWWRGWSEAK